VLHILLQQFQGFRVQVENAIATGKKRDPHGGLSLIPTPVDGYFASSDMPDVLRACTCFTFAATLLETWLEMPLWHAIGHVIARRKACGQSVANLTIADESFQSELASCAGIDNSKAQNACRFAHTSFTDPSELRIYHWAKLVLAISADEPLLPLFWQQLFRLYFSRCGTFVFGYVQTLHALTLCALRLHTFYTKCTPYALALFILCALSPYARYTTHTLHY
jgi:hypothetical protein